jgi:hypothetical protein
MRKMVSRLTQNEHPVSLNKTHFSNAVSYVTICTLLARKEQPLRD